MFFIDIIFFHTESLKACSHEKEVQLLAQYIKEKVIKIFIKNVSANFMDLDFPYWTLYRLK